MAEILLVLLLALVIVFNYSKDRVSKESANSCCSHKLHWMGDLNAKGICDDSVVLILFCLMLYLNCFYNKIIFTFPLHGRFSIFGSLLFLLLIHMHECTCNALYSILTCSKWFQSSIYENIILWLQLFYNGSCRKKIKVCDTFIKSPFLEHCLLG